MVTRRRGSYVPDRGDLIWLSFDPQAGHEQAGRRPGLVLSPVLYNRRSGLALVCPVTSQIKGYPFEVTLPQGLSLSGVVLADHVRSLDWRARRAEFAEQCSPDLVHEVAARITPLLGS
jgi:mRNA interferase MazF